MSLAPWIATLLGLALGVAAAYVFAKLLVPYLVLRSPDRLLAVRLALGGTVVALAPALLLALVAGATLGGALGAQITRAFGLGASGAPLGLALGTAFVFAVVLLSGMALGVLVARLLARAES